MSPDSWPQYLVVRETLPPEGRILAAASAALAIGDEALSALILNADGDHSASLVVDESTIQYEASFADYRALILGWLSGHGGDLSATRKISQVLMHQRSQRPETPPDAPLEKGKALILDAIQLRWTGLADFVTPGVDGLGMENIRRSFNKLVGIVVSSGPVPSDEVADAIRIEGLSDFDAAVWAKYCGELLAISGNYEASLVALTDANVRAEKLLGRGAAPQLLAAIGRGLISCKTMLNDRSETMEALKGLRREHRGGADAAATAWLLTHNAMVWHQERGGEWPRAKGERVTVVSRQDGLDTVHSARTEMLSNVIAGRDDEGEMWDWIATRAIAAMGLFPYHAYIAEVRARLYLRRFRPSIQDALHSMVISGRSESVKALAEFVSADSGARLRGAVNPSLLQNLAATSGRLESQIAARRAVLANILKVCAEQTGWSEMAVDAMCTQLCELLEGDGDSELVLQARGASFDGLSSLCHGEIESISKSALTRVAAIAKKNMSPEGRWNEIKSALTVIGAISSRLDGEEVSDLVIAIVSMLEGRFSDGGGDWAVVRPALACLTDDPMRLVVRSDENLRRRIQPLVARFCFLADDPADLSGWNMGLFVTDRLGLDTVGGTKRAIRLYVTHAQEVSSSNAPRAIIDLLATPDVLDDDDACDMTRAATRLVENAIASNGRTAGGQLPGAVFAAAHYWAGRELTDPARNAVRDLSGACGRFVRAAIQRPALMAQFGIPVNRDPHPTLVFNWTYATLALGHVLGEVENSEYLLNEMRQVPGLAEPAGRAREEFRAFGVAGEGRMEAAPNRTEIEGASRDTFYGALGPWLERILRAGHSDTVSILLEQCFRYGPRLEDLAVISAASALGLMRLRPSVRTVLSGYRDRLTRSVGGVPEEIRRILLEMTHRFG